jgi:hypothetical protein
LSCFGVFPEITPFLTPETNFSDSTGGEHTGDLSSLFSHHHLMNTTYAAFFDRHALSQSKSIYSTSKCGPCPKKTSILVFTVFLPLQVEWPCTAHQPFVYTLMGSHVCIDEELEDLLI